MKITRLQKKIQFIFIFLLFTTLGYSQCASFQFDVINVNVVTSCGGNDGEIHITTQGGTGTLTYEVTGQGSNNSGDFTGLLSGYYTVTVTDGNSCSIDSANVYVGYATGITAPKYVLDVGQPDCGKDNGSINFIVQNTGDLNSPITYSIDVGAMPVTNTTGNFSGLAPGTYSIKVTDNGSSCPTVSQVVLVDQGHTNENSSFDYADFCANSLGGDTSNILTPGGTFSFDPAPGNGESIDPLSGEITGAVGGTTYQVKYTTNGFCPTSTVVSVKAMVAPKTQVAVTNPKCLKNNGVIDVTVQNSSSITGDLTFSVGNGVPDQTNDGHFEPLSPNTYTVKVTSVQNGCVDSVKKVLSNIGTPITAKFSFDNFCAGTTGTPYDIQPLAVPGSFSFKNNPGGGVSIDPGSGKITNAVGGTTYTVKYVAQGACPDSVTHDVTAYSNPDISIDSINPNCYVSDGEIMITLNNASSLTTPIIYSIGNGNTQQDDGHFTGLDPGSYTITVTDNNGCITTGIKGIDYPEGPTFTITKNNDIKCIGESNGSATVVVSGGTYTYSWESGENSKTSTQLSLGWNTVKVTDGGNCSTIDSIYITQPTPLSATAIIDSSDCYAPTGYIKVNPQGGTPPYTYHWDNDTTTFYNMNLEAGSHHVTITDGNGCVLDTSFVINEIPGLPVKAIPHITTITKGESIKISVQVPGDALSYVYTWDPSTGLDCNACPFPIATPKEPTTYTVIVEDTIHGCVGGDSLLIIVKSPCGEVFVPNIFSPNGDHKNDKLCVQGGCFTSYHFEVFDRWGETVFESNDRTKCWDGTYQEKGKTLNTGSYVYKLHAVTKKKKVINRSGSITLIR